MADNTVALSQDELDKVLNNIRNDNAENGKAFSAPSAAVSQAELDRLLGGGSTKTTKPDPANTEPHRREPISMGVITGVQSSEADHAAKIAERKARAAELLAKVNAASPKRLSVVYGTVMRKGEAISQIKAGDSIMLDRLTEDVADILLDGKPFARGKLTTEDGYAAVRVTEIL